ncbi:MAG: hypothetical protein ICV61_14230, partial [Microcoleus sp. Co-bin12]|nr:hypothetical protein [Microcoleus sp. Co-bin12]
TAFETEPTNGEMSATGELDAIQNELDNHIAHLVFSAEETDADNLVMEYEASSAAAERNNDYETGGLNLPSLDAARQQFINELKNLPPGESPAPAIERFLPAAIMALQPVIKMAISIIGRQKVINFLAGLLAKLIGKYVPEATAKPLAASIIDVGMSAIGFETYETDKADVAYEAIANTIQDTIQNLSGLNEQTLNDNEALTAQLLEAFEPAAANNFPPQYIREDLRPSTQPGVWVLKPRSGPRHLYKKYSRVFPVTIDPQTAQAVTTFRGVPLANFIRDKLGLDPSKPIQARVHLYQSIPGTKLTHIANFEKVPGLSGQRYAWVQLHPLSKNAAALLLKEPGLGKDFSAEYTSKRRHIAVGQRFYYLEISGARLKVITRGHRSRQQPATGQQPVSQQPTGTTGSNGTTGSTQPAQSGDIQGVINFVKSEIRFN